MSRVIVRPATYEGATLRTTVFEMLEAAGGAGIRSGHRVLIKPNLLCPATPAQAVLTHPTVVRSAVEYCLEKGARPLLADSPAIGAFGLILRLSGIRDALRGLAVECRPFAGSARVDVGAPFGAIEIAEEAVSADVIVNLAKFKTHNQMLLTLAVKNLFGCIIGYRKPEWHMRAGIDRQAFASLLVRIAQTLRPAVNLLDGVLAMEGEGPRSGTPRPLGVLMAGSDPFSVDLAACRMIGVEPGRYPVLAAANALGALPAAPEIDGVLPPIRGFRLPALTSLPFGPKFLRGLVRRRLLRRPVCNAAACRMCGACWRICPAKAIVPDEAPLRFDYERCIRCYCCTEVCPEGALHTAETLAGKVLRRAVAAVLPPGPTR